MKKLKLVIEKGGFFLWQGVSETVITGFNMKKRVIKRPIFFVYESDDLLHFQSYSKQVALSKLIHLTTP